MPHHAHNGRDSQFLRANDLGNFSPGGLRQETGQKISRRQKLNPVEA
jgi:hypothetical protein